MEYVEQFNFFLFVAFTLAYGYQWVYMLVGLFSKPKAFEAKRQAHYACIISARNEEAVIGSLIDTIKKQSYPSHLIDVFVVADNCTDSTAEVSRKAGAIVYERFNKEQVGKGYALNYLFHHIAVEHADKNIDAYIVFDADNLLDENFILEMNNVYTNGYDMLTSYRNSKNYGDNWLSAGYSLWFLREARYANNPRMILNKSCAISGTGFLVSKDIIDDANGWIYHSLTEDIEFSIATVIGNRKIGYCHKAVLYDEQPTEFAQSFNQRARWSKGFYQVFGGYGKDLFLNIFKTKSFSSYDMFITVFPGIIVSLVTALFTFFYSMNGLANTSGIFAIPYYNMLLGMTKSMLLLYCVFFVMGFVTTMTEWKNINCPAHKKIMYLFTFPFYLASYVPISIYALFNKIEWKPIQHSVHKTLDEIR